MARLVRIAAAQYAPAWLDGFAAYEDKISALVDEAVRGGAQLLVFPEYGLMELASLAGKADAGSLRASLRTVAEHSSAAQQLFARLAVSHALHILAPSGPAQAADGRFHNRAVLHGPDGRSGHQDKLIMTRFEREAWGVSAGAELALFATRLGSIGVLICYDAEFPLAARALVAAGAELLLVPSCTDSHAGHARVRIGTMARALEGQCVAVVAPLVGTVDWSPAIDINIGAAGIYGPPDRGFPESGVIAEGALNVPGWVQGEVDLDRIADVRRNGQVLNFRHWDEQPGAAGPSIDIVRVPLV